MLQSLRDGALWACESVSPYPERDAGKPSTSTVVRCSPSLRADPMTQVRAMLEALRHSNEPEHLVNEAKRYLRGLKGHLVQMKRQKEAKEHAAREAEAASVFQAARAPVWKSAPTVHF